MQILRREWQNYQTSRRLAELWESYAAVAPAPDCSAECTLRTLPHFTKFLDAFEAAIITPGPRPGLASKLKQPFREAPACLSALTTYFRAFAGVSSVTPQQLATLTRMLRALKPLLCREQKTENAPGALVGGLLAVMWHFEDEGVRVHTLKAVTWLSPEGKKELVKLGGVEQILALILDKRRHLTKLVIRTVKMLLTAKPLEMHKTHSLKTKIFDVIGGATKLAYLLFPAEEHEFCELVDQFPPTETALAQAKEGGVAPGEEAADGDFSCIVATHGAISSILEAFDHEASLDLIETLGLFLCRNERNKQEFAELGGFNLLYDFFDRIDVLQDPAGVQLLGAGFKVLQLIVLDGERSDLVRNSNALGLLLKLLGTGSNLLIIHNSVKALLALVEKNWRNVPVIYDCNSLEHYKTAFERLLSPEFAQDSLEVLSQFDHLSRYMSFIMGHQAVQNGWMIEVYSSALALHSATLSMPAALLVLSSLEGMIGDLNARVYTKPLMPKEHFLLLFDTMRTAAAAVAVVDLGKETLPLVMHLIEYELRYYELLFSISSVDPLRTLFSLSPEFRKQFKIMGVEGAWAYENLLVLHSGVSECTEELLEHCRTGCTSEVVSVLLMDLFPNIETCRGPTMRRKFLAAGGMTYIKETLPAREAVYLLLACLKDSPELKRELHREFPVEEIMAIIPEKDLGFHLVLDLVIVREYLALCGYHNTLRNYTGLKVSEVIYRVMYPEHLFQDVVTTSRGSTAPSSLMSSMSESDPLEFLTTLDLIDSPYIELISLFIAKSPVPLQRLMFVHLNHLLCNYNNKRTLSKYSVGEKLLALLPTLDPQLTELAFEALFKLFSYAVTPAEASELLQLTSGAFSQQATSTVLKTLSLDTTASFYYLDRSHLQTSGVTQFPRSGYTLVFWVKLRALSEEGTSLFSWVNSTKSYVSFLLSYNHSQLAVGKQSKNSRKHKLFPDTKSRLTLHVSKQNRYISKTDSESVDFELSRDWTHLAIVHGKQELALYLNGKLLVTRKAFNFSAGKDRALTVGRFGDSSANALLAGICCVEGCLEQGILERIYNSGVGCTPELEGKSLFSLLEGDSSLLPTKSPLKEPILHSTSNFKPVLKEVNGIGLFFEMLAGDDLLNGLKMITESVCRDQGNYCEFIERGGWAALSELSIKQQNCLDEDIFRALLAPLVDVPRPLCKFIKILTIKQDEIPLIVTERRGVLSFVAECLSGGVKPKILSPFIEGLGNLMYREENVKSFLSEMSGMEFVLHLGVRARGSKSLTYQTLSLFEKLVNFISAENLEFLLDFLVAPCTNPVMVEVEQFTTGVLSLLAIHLHLNTGNLLEKFCSFEAVSLVYELLKIDSEPIRCAALKIIGLLQSKSSKLLKKSLKPASFLGLLLQKLPSGMPTYKLLLRLSLNSICCINHLYPEASSSIKTIMNHSLAAAKATPRKEVLPKKVTFPDYLEVLLELLRQEPSVPLVTDTLLKIKKLLNPENCEKLLDCAFICWLSLLQSPALHRTPLVEIMATLCSFDMNRPARSFKIFSWFNKNPDTLDSPIFLFNCVLEGLELSPNLELQPVNIKHFLQNFMKVLNSSELVCSQETNLRVMQVINLLASSNTPAVRSLMKTLEYFDKRDSLLLQTLRGQLPPGELLSLITNYSFATLANQAKFRESQASLHFVKLLVEASEDLTLQLALLQVLKEDICTTEENRKLLRKALETPEFLEFLFGQKYEDSLSFGCFRPASIRIELSFQVPIELKDPVEILRWLNGEQRAREEILNCISKVTEPLEEVRRMSGLKTLENRAVRRKKIVEGFLKDKGAVQRAFTEFEGKLAGRVARSEEKLLSCSQVLLTR